MKNTVNKAAATLFGSLLVATTLGTVGCGDDSRDAFNDVVLPPTSTATATTTTSTSSSTTQTQTQTAPTVVALGIALDQGVLGVEPTNATGVALFPAASVSAPPANTNYAGSTFSVSLPATATGLTLTAPTSSIGTVTGSGTQTVSVTLNSSATAAQVQDFVRNIRVVSNNATLAQQSTVTVTATGPNGSGQTATVTNTGRSVRVQGASAMTLTVDPSQASAPASNRYQSLQEAVNAVAGRTTGTTPVDNGTNDGRQGSQITLVAGTYSVPSQRTGSAKDGIRALQLASNGSVLIGVHSVGQTSDPDLAGLTISGPNAAVSAGSVPGTRVSEAIVQGGIVVGAPNVRLQGFTISGGGDYEGIGDTQGTPIDGVDVNVGARNLTISNVIFTGTNGSATYYNNGIATSNNVNGSDNSNLTVTGCAFTGWFNGMQPYTGDITERRTGDVVDGSFFSGMFNAGISFEGADNETVTNCVFKSQAAIQGVAHISVYRTTTVGVVATNNSFDNTADNVLVTSDGEVVKANLQSNWWNSASGPATPNGTILTNTNHPAVVTYDVGTGTGTTQFTTTNFLTANPFPGR